MDKFFLELPLLGVLCDDRPFRFSSALASSGLDINDVLKVKVLQGSRNEVSIDPLDPNSLLTKIWVN